MRILTLLTFSMSILLNGCNRPGGNKDCTHAATLRDMSGLDACGWMLELDNGEKLQPVSPDDLKGVELKDGQKVRVGFTYDPERVSACMAGKMVKITCIEKAE